MKQKKAKTKYKHVLCLAFVFIANELDPSEKPFYELGLCVSSGFLNTRTYEKHLGRRLVHQFVRVYKP